MFEWCTMMLGDILCDHELMRLHVANLQHTPGDKSHCVKLASCKIAGVVIVPLLCYTFKPSIFRTIP